MSDMQVEQAVETAASDRPSRGGERGSRGRRGDNRGRGGERRGRATDAAPSEWEEKVVSLRRATKVVSGGKRFRFNALVVVGNKKGKVGLGYGKANELADAIKKAKDKAIANAITIRMKGTTIPHEVLGAFKASRILMKPATKGTGVIAGGAVRPVLELLGIQDVLTKSLNSPNPVNLVKAAFSALESLYLIEDVAAKRGKTVAEVLGK